MTQCLYCDKTPILHDLMIEIAPLSVSSVFLFKEQTYHGRCLVAYNKHNVELYELNDEELLAFMQDVNKVAAVMKQVLGAAKINYGAYSDKLAHLHFHLIPKYIDGPDYGSVFAMNPQQKYLSQREYDELIQQLKKELI